MNFHFTCILFMNGSHLWLNHKACETIAEGRKGEEVKCKQQFLFFQVYSFCILLNSFIIDVGILVINAISTIDNALKTGIFPSNAKFRICHSLRTFPVLVMCFRKFSSSSIFLLYEKWIPQILIVLNFKSIYLAPFSVPVPTSAHLPLLGFKPEKDPLSFRKKKCSLCIKMYG